MLSDSSKPLGSFSLARLFFDPSLVWHELVRKWILPRWFRLYCALRLELYWSAINSVEYEWIGLGCLRVRLGCFDFTGAATPMQQLQLQQAQIQREQARINDFWNNVVGEMSQIDPEKVKSNTTHVHQNFLRIATRLLGSGLLSRPNSNEHVI